MTAVNPLMGEARQVNTIDIDDTPRGQVRRYWLHLTDSGLSEPINIPVIVARGQYDGPTLGLTAALHGNELNGIPLIQQLFQDLDARRLSGVLVGALVVNVPGFDLSTRRFSDSIDLNRIAPGRHNGNESQVYIHRVCEKLLPALDYLIDLHTASLGRVNSWYIRADMGDPKVSRMARLQNPQIILNNPANDGTFRGAADIMGVPAITLELRDPHVVQLDVVEEALDGVRNILYDFGMLEGRLVTHMPETVLCSRSFWIYTDRGGLLEVLPPLVGLVAKDQPIAHQYDMFGRLVREYLAPEDGIIIGKSSTPISQAGSRILHLGLEPREIPCIV